MATPKITPLEMFKGDAVVSDKVDSSTNHSLETRVAIVELLTNKIEKEVSSIENLKTELLNNHHHVKTLTHRCNRFAHEINSRVAKMEQLIVNNDLVLNRYKKFMESHVSITKNHEAAIAKLHEVIKKLDQENKDLNEKLSYVEGNVKFHDIKFDKFARHGMILEERINNLEVIKSDTLRISSYLFKVCATIGGILGGYAMAKDAGIVEWVAEMLSKL